MFYSVLPARLEKTYCKILLELVRQSNIQTFQKRTTKAMQVGIEGRQSNNILCQKGKIGFCFVLSACLETLLRNTP